MTERLDWAIETNHPRAPAPVSRGQPDDRHPPDAELEELRREFVEGLPEQAAALDAALKLMEAAPAEAAQVIRRVAHRLRGSGGSYGFPELTEAGAAAELAEPGDLADRGRELIALIRRVTRRARERGQSRGRRPRKAAKDAPPSPAAAAVLIVEDDVALSRLLEAALRAPDRELVLASSAAEAARLAAERTFALVLLDLHLPDGDGRRLLAQWRETGRTRDVPVFVLSADLDEETKAECFAAGADGFFDKPIRPEAIATAVSSRLRRLVLTSQPPAPPAGTTVPSPPAAIVKSRRPEVLSALIVEDDPFVGGMVRHRLARAGFTVRQAADGAQGLAAVAAAEPSVVVLDLNLPELNGFQFLEHLRSDPATHGIPVLVLTASGAEKDLVRAFSIGANDYLVKPFSPTELVARVQRLVAGPDVSPAGS